jgi:NADPH2:quinone reductase
MQETGDRGVDVVFDNVGEAVVEKSLRCTAYNGRYLMMGFASDKTVADEKWIVPRRVMAANLKLCGVLLAYAPEPAVKLMKKAMGWNFAPRALGEKIMREITERVLAKQLRPVIGSVIEFEQIPSAIEAMANRQSVGRTIVRLY